MSAILLIIAALILNSNALIIVGTAAVLHLPLLKWRRLSYFYIVFDSLLVSVAIATTSLGNPLNNYIQQVLPIEAEGSSIILAIILWFFICIISLKIEKSMLTSYVSKQQRKWQMTSSAKKNRTKSNQNNAGIDKNIIQGKNGYYISYETKEPPFDKEPTVVLRNNHGIVLHYQELSELCCEYLTKKESAIQKAKEYGIEHEIINLAKNFVTNYGIRYFDQSMEKDLEIIDKKAAEI